MANIDSNEFEEQAEVGGFCSVELKEAGYEVSYVGPVRV